MQTTFNAVNRKMPQWYMDEFNQSTAVLFPIQVSKPSIGSLFFGALMFVVNVAYWIVSFQRLELLPLENIHHFMLCVAFAVLGVFGLFEIVNYLGKIRTWNQSITGELTLGLYFNEENMILRNHRNDVTMISKQDVIEVGYKTNGAKAQYITVQLRLKCLPEPKLFIFYDYEYVKPRGILFSDIIKEWLNEDFEVFQRRYQS